MTPTTALDQAISLLVMPSRARTLHAAPLPAGVDLVLKILAGDSEAESAAQQETARTDETIRAAAEFYANEILFASHATAYRVLGAEPGAPRDLLRANMILLMRWLHPDTGAGRIVDDQFNRVLSAWGILQSDTRRAAYDRMLRERHAPVARQAASAAPHADSGRVETNPFLNQAAGRARRRPKRRIVYLVMLALLVVLGLIFFDRLLASIGLEASNVLHHRFSLNEYLAAAPAIASRQTAMHRMMS